MIIPNIWKIENVPNHKAKTHANIVQIICFAHLFSFCCSLMQHSNLRCWRSDMLPLTYCWRIPVLDISLYVLFSGMGTGNAICKRFKPMVIYKPCHPIKRLIFTSLHPMRPWHPMRSSNIIQMFTPQNPHIKISIPLKNDDFSHSFPMFSRFSSLFNQFPRFFPIFPRFSTKKNPDFRPRRPPKTAPPRPGVCCRRPGWGRPTSRRRRRPAAPRRRPQRRRSSVEATRKPGMWVNYDEWLLWVYIYRY